LLRIFCFVCPSCRACALTSHNADDLNAQGRTARAKKIIANYIDVRGSFAINISSALNERIMHLKESKDIPFAAFDAAELEIKRMLTRGAYARFLDRQQHAAHQTVTPL